MQDTQRPLDLVIITPILIASLATALRFLNKEGAIFFERI